MMTENDKKYLKGLQDILGTAHTEITKLSLKMLASDEIDGKTVVTGILAAVKTFSDTFEDAAIKMFAAKAKREGSVTDKKITENQDD